MIYIDSDYHCHATNPDNDRRAFEIPLFEGKCREFIEGFIYVPHDEQWTRPSDGKVFLGEMLCAWQPYSQLDDAQRAYEQQLLAEYMAKLNELGVTLS